jgi:pimeloyl-ACP methyl ester carboxylesterase
MTLQQLFRLGIRSSGEHLHGWFLSHLENNGCDKMPVRLSVTLLLVLLTACRPLDSRLLDRQVDIGTHSLHLRCTGTGTPAVVIDVGAGESYTSWQSLQEQLARDVRVCLYARAGYDGSEPGPLPRHSRQVARELKLLLEHAGIPGPYLLVGHSLGGVNVQVFAADYPERVAGLVLLDPTPLRWLTGEEFPELRALFEQQTREMAAAAAAMADSADPETRARAGFLKMLASEHAELLGASGRQAAAIRTFGDLPLTVIASGQPNPMFGAAAQPFQDFWIEQSRSLAQKSTAGAFILAAASGHQIHQDAPAQVVAAIRAMLAHIAN